MTPPSTPDSSPSIRIGNLRLSNSLSSYFPNPSLEQNFVAYEGKLLRFPDKISEPSQEFLEFHRNSIFNNAS
jgi:hypothetical protein